MTKEAFHIEKQDRTYIGALLAIVGFMFLAFATTCSKALTGQFPATTLLFFQFFIPFLMLLPFVIKGGVASIKTQRLGLLSVRAFGGLLSYFLFLLSLKTVPLVNANVLLNAAPIWVPFIMFFWMKESVKRSLWLWMLMGFFGVILILHPKGSAFVHAGTLLALSAGILYAFTMVCVRKLSHTETPRHILFYYFGISSLVSMPFVLMNWQPMSMDQFLILLMAGASMFFCQFLFTLALNYARPSLVSTLAYATVIFAGILGFIFWHQVPGSLAIAGILLIIIGGVMTVLIESKS